jgi:hypothetical protein
MRLVQKFQTADGATHDTEGQARRHTEKRYGEPLSRLAHQLVRIEQYSDMTAFLDEHLAEFAELARIKEDLKLEPEEDSHGTLR